MADVKFIRVRGRVVPIHNDGEKRGRGRPKGSKNKATVAAKAIAKQAEKVPAKFKSAVYQGVALRHGIEKGAAAGLAAAGGIAATRRFLFSRGSRLSNVAAKYAARPNPAVPVDRILKKGGGFKNAAPTMFQMKTYEKAKKFFGEGQRKAAKFGAQGDKYMMGARFLRAHGVKIAIGAGIAAGGYSYFYKRAKMTEED